MPTSGTPQGQGVWGPLGTEHKDFEWVRDQSLNTEGVLVRSNQDAFSRSPLSLPQPWICLGHESMQWLGHTQPNSWKPRERVKPLQLALVCEDKVISSAGPSPRGWCRPGWRPVNPRPVYACQHVPSGLFPKSLNLCCQRWLHSAPLCDTGFYWKLA